MDPVTSDGGYVPVIYCERQKRWLPMEGHLECEHCAAPVFDYDGEPVSFLCTYHGEKREFEPGFHERVEEGRGPPARPHSSGVEYGDEPHDPRLD